MPNTAKDPQVALGRAIRLRREELGISAIVTVSAMRLFYVDDSGNEAVTTFSAVSVSVRAWTVALDSWLGWRRHLHSAHGIDVRVRLHAADWLAGRGRPSDDSAAAINRSKPIRWREFVSALDAIAAMPDVQVMTVVARGDRRKPPYRSLMVWIDRRLREADDHGLIVLDGESGELRTMHRELDIATRRVVEDPWMRDARESQWPQVADFVAHVAFQAIVRAPSRAFLWEWYEQRLGTVIVRDEWGRHGVRGLE
ncbi:MAG: DUF3800 domain-containing protein [Solirubrobacteraceae bacterium]